MTRLPRAEIEKRTVKILRERSWIAPQIRLLDLDGRLVVVKDFSVLPLATRLAVGLPLVRHESSILNRLVGLEGVPQFVAPVDRFAFAMSHLETRTLYKVPPAEIPADIFARLFRLLDALHARGVVHLDLRQRKNILLQSGGQPAFIDFASALFFRSRGRMYRFACGVDRTAILKLKNRMRPEELTEEEKETLRSFDKMRKFWVIRPRVDREKNRVRD